ncbi:hypothetical protein RRG08_047003 [Elysia crispata]|uniref:Integrase catalytic domain-containing protein n=1 Tax=Elysia crispata TaxID=231223 RepID=A0AAE1DU68_9GAST|nr:hypothetical protein RRG08_047003 [Elysia crispata]
MSQRVQEWERKRLGNPQRQNRMNQLSYAVGGSYPPEDNARIGPKFKGKPDRAPLVGILASETLELVCTDFLKVDSAQNGTQYILIVSDHFTRFAMAVPTRNMLAKATAEVLLTFVRNFVIPKRLHADQGAYFESKVIRALCQLLGVEESRTTPFHPMGNGSCERMNQTLISMLGTLPLSIQRTPVFVVEPVNGGRKRTLHRNLFLPVESVREDRPDVSPDNVATRKALPSAKTNRTPGSISAMPLQVLPEDEVKGTTSELELEDDGESEFD